MAERGDVQTDTLKGVGDPSVPVIVLPLAQELEECCYDLLLFGDNTSAETKLDTLRNDLTGLLRFYDDSVTAVDFVIQKCVNGVFADQHTIIDNTYGLFKPLGTEVINGLNYITIKDINWTLILLNFGEGKYRIQTNETTIFPALGIQHQPSFTYTLQNFTETRANNTVYFEIRNSGSLGNRKKVRERFSFPEDWRDGIRLKGKFGDDFDPITTEYTVYEDGSKVSIEKTREEKYIFLFDSAPDNIRKFFKNELAMADFVLVTDYNTNNASCHIETPAQVSGGIEPDYIKQYSKASIEVEFTSAFENMKKEPC